MWRNKDVKAQRFPRYFGIPSNMFPERSRETSLLLVSGNNQRYMDELRLLLSRIRFPIEEEEFKNEEYGYMTFERTNRLGNGSTKRIVTKIKVTPLHLQQSSSSALHVESWPNGSSRDALKSKRARFSNWWPTTVVASRHSKRRRGGFKCEPLFGCEREDNRERDTWWMTRRHVKYTADD
ncbi:hypothetical protein OSB04_010172 [Centaurea solstitialis]|uniref:Uncharacterized protein n=1 Tax=Centaurea solstitialis TaxID=347529 RepID=A0AA38TEL0_9ASTR|nr:hypothetical protein OSB04_010172 [Centaurea solstitialis]